MMVWKYIKAYSWVLVALALVALGYMVVSQRMRTKALRMQVEALQALRDAKARRADRDKAIDAKAARDVKVIVETRDDATAKLVELGDALDKTGADHDGLDKVDTEVNAYIRRSIGETFCEVCNRPLRHGRGGTGYCDCIGPI